MATITVEEFSKRMDEVQRHIRSGLVDPHYGTLSEQGRLLCGDIMKLTPARSEDQQRHAIRNDLLNIFQIFPEQIVKVVTARKGAGRIDAWVHDDKQGIHIYVSVAGVASDLGRARSIHSSNYTSRGRTRRLLGATTQSKQKTQGEKFMISPSVFSSYLREVYLKVGIARAGWLPSASRLLTPNLPSYVLRHAPGEGIFIDGRDAARPFIDVRNTSRWAKLRDEGLRIVNSAIGTRMRSMTAYFQKQAELAFKKAHLT